MKLIKSGRKRKEKIKEKAFIPVGYIPPTEAKKKIDPVLKAQYLFIYGSLDTHCSNCKDRKILTSLENRIKALYKRTKEYQHMGHVLPHCMHELVRLCNIYRKYLKDSGCSKRKLILV